MSENLTAFRQILAKVGKQKLDKRAGVTTFYPMHPFFRCLQDLIS